MRSVRGRTDRVVVVGAGFAGLSAALHLAGRGREVTVVEREPWPGGRAGRRDINGYLIDTGPTVLTMPDIIDESFAAVGESLSQRVDLLPVDPAYRAMFADGADIDVYPDAERMAASVREFAGPQEASGYRALRDWLDRLYRTEFEGFIAANFDSPLSMLTPQLARLAGIGGFRRWDTMVRRFISDPRLRRVFTFQALYAGVAPQHALAVYAVIAYMDTVSGVFFPRGGVRALPDALAAAAQDAGVQFRYGSTVTALERTGERINAVITGEDDRLECDAVVLTTELPLTYQLLGRRPKRLLSLRAAPSAVVIHVGCRAVEPPSPHHAILFGDAWEQTFTDIIRDGQLMRDPSLLVTRPTASDPSLAPAGRDLLYVLAPAPNLDRSRIDWSSTAAPYAQTMLDAVQQRLLPGLRDGAEVLHIDTPADWARRGMLAGTPFALAHTFAQTGPFRPANLLRGIDNAVLAGSSTTPGVGVPTTLISGRLAADRITGVPERSRTRWWRPAAPSSAALGIATTDTNLDLKAHLP
ncbi:phytoene desaturase family protein [Mycobacterium sp.]|uniref:phytoene desaturase family protein n=1 Tax=Mycobacterium sp. TaxID=1785 RepID=UPI002B949BC1|nr:phytoene desaturase family protein [Mycobacterium sp.]HTQ16521.1 phytoene desaturase family protein [Mycobacterium sp.]